MKPTLVILAAGMASRYGSMKQVEGFGPSGETIMEYSIYDAIRAGFGKVVFIIRKEYASSFSDAFTDKLKNKIAIDYVFQELDMFTDGFKVPPDRTKPWGTAHAVLCARAVVKEPFAVINADDFYGRDGFVKAFDFLTQDVQQNIYAIVGYELLKTLSEHGTVNRGVCQADKSGNLISIAERLNVARKGDVIVCDDGMQPRELPLDTLVSMNFWCFATSVFDYTQKQFSEFLEQNSSQPKAEFFIPIVADKFVKDNVGTIRILPTSAQWFGVTYKDDAPSVRQNLKKLITEGEYPDKLW